MLACSSCCPVCSAVQTKITFFSFQREIFKYSANNVSSVLKITPDSGVTNIIIGYISSWYTLKTCYVHPVQGEYFISNDYANGGPNKSL